MVDARLGNKNVVGLQQWRLSRGPPCGYTTAGRHPAVVEGVAEMTVCFNYGSATSTCFHHYSVGVVRCAGASGCGGCRTCTTRGGGERGYCTVESGL